MAHVMFDEVPQQVQTATGVTEDVQRGMSDGVSGFMS